MEPRLLAPQPYIRQINYPRHHHPNGSTQPAPLVDHVLGEAYYVVKDVYLHLLDLEEFLSKLDVAEDLKQELVTKITEAQEKAESLEDQYEQLTELSNDVKDDLDKSQDIFNQIQLIKLDADGVKDALEEVKDLSNKIESEVLTFSGLGCVQSVWEADASYGEGAEIELEVSYLVGRNHLRLAWNGLMLFKDKQYEEVGTPDQLSKTVKLLFPVQEGDEINAWVAALGKQEVADAIDKAERALIQIKEILSTAAFLEGNQIYHNGDDGREDIAPQTTADQVSITDADGEESNVLAEVVSLREGVQNALAAGIHFRGAVTKANGLPTEGYKSGWQYTVKETGTYAGQVCEVGDLIICIKDFSEEFKDSDWSVLQANYETEKQDLIRELTDDEVDAISL